MKLDIKVHNYTDPPQQDLFVILTGPHSQMNVVGPYTSYDDAQEDVNRIYKHGDIVRVAMPGKSYYRLIVPPGHTFTMKGVAEPVRAFGEVTFWLTGAEYRQRLANGWVDAPAEGEHS